MLNLSKGLATPVQARDGRPARILAMDLNDGFFTMAVAVTCPDGKERLSTRRADGRYYLHDDDSDIVNVPEPLREQTVWVNVFRDGPGVALHPTRKMADKYAGGDRIACVKVKIAYREGQFDE